MSNIPRSPIDLSVYYYYVVVFVVVVIVVVSLITGFVFLVLLWNQWRSPLIRLQVKVCILSVLCVMCHVQLSLVVNLLLLLLLLLLLPM